MLVSPVVRLQIVGAAFLSAGLCLTVVLWFEQGLSRSNDVFAFDDMHVAAALFDEAVGGLTPSAAQPLVGGKTAQLRNAEVTFAPLGPAARPFFFSGTADERARARFCLAAAMAYEAGGDLRGQLAVGQVVLNRLHHPAFPGTVCGVVTQGSERSTGCQFTFTCDGSLHRDLPRQILPRQIWTRAWDRADLLLNGFVFADVGLATHYHADYVRPWWSPRLEKIARVGPHLFFRWPGAWNPEGTWRMKRRGREPSTVLLSRAVALDLLPAPGTAAERLSGSLEASIAGTQEPRSDAVIPLPLKPQTAPAGLTEPGASGRQAIPVERRLVAHIPPQGYSASPYLDRAVLGGNRLLRAFAEEGVFFLEVTRGGAPASRRRAAAFLCGGRSACEVYGWEAGVPIPEDPRVSRDAGRTAAFTFVRRPSLRTSNRPPSASDF